MNTVVENNLNENRAENFNKLYSLNVNDKAEKKGSLSYLSWSFAWAEFKKIYPDATYRVIQNPVTNLPFFEDRNLGIMVFTEVSADGLVYQMWLPVMNSSNKAMKSYPYSYNVFNRNKNTEETITVEAATMFDVNKSIMRCLTKNLAMFGLGLYIFNGEDVPADATNNVEHQQIKTTAIQKRTAPRVAPSTTDRYSGIRNALSSINSMDNLMGLYNQHRSEVEGNPEIKAMFSNKKNELLMTA